MGKWRYVGYPVRRDFGSPYDLARTDDVHHPVCVLSVILTLFVLLHKSKGGGLSDLFGGGVSTSMGGTSMAERNLDRLTIVMGLLWLASIIVLLVLYSHS